MMELYLPLYLKLDLHKHSILTGEVESYCLICESYLPTEDAAHLHKDNPRHQKNLAAATFVEKYKSDRIIKVKKGYYCTYCNILLPIITKVGLHVEETEHKENIEAEFIVKVGNNIVAFDEVVISPESWHGMLENTCLICNIEYDNEEKHKTHPPHVLKLIQSKYEFGDKFVYRTVDKNSFFCLICKKVYANKDKSTHHDDDGHKSAYNSAKELYNKVVNMPINLPTASPSQSKATSVTEIAVITETDAEESKASNGAKKKIFAAKSTEPDVPDSTKSAKKNKRVPKVKDFIDNFQGKQAKINDPRRSNRKTEHKIKEYLLNANSYIIKEDDDIFTCALCEITGIAHEDLDTHLTKDLHHQMMLKKSKEKLFKKVKGSDAQMTEKFAADNLIHNGNKIALNIPENSGKAQANPTEKAIPSYQEVRLERAPPVDVQLRIRERDPDSDISSDGEDDFKAKIVDDVHVFQENEISIDFTTERAWCKRCEKDLPFDHEAITCHLSLHHQLIAERFARCDAEHDMILRVESYAQENFISVHRNEGYCILCNVKVTLKLELMAQHVESSEHQERVSSRDESGPGKTVLASQVMETFYQIESNTGSDIILNNSFVLRHLSFHCITQDDGLYCALCDIYIPSAGDPMLHHMNTIAHKLKMGSCQVVTTVPQEFIREVSPGQYHCGYCNRVVSQWSAMQTHLQSIIHAAARRNGLWNLERCHTLMRNARPLQPSRTLSNPTATQANPSAQRRIEMRLHFAGEPENFSYYSLGGAAGGDAQTETPQPQEQPSETRDPEPQPGPSQTPGI